MWNLKKRLLGMIIMVFSAVTSVRILTGCEEEDMHAILLRKYLLNVLRILLLLVDGVISVYAGKVIL